MSPACWLLSILVFLLAAILLLPSSIIRRQPQKVISSPEKYNLDFTNASFTTEDGVPLHGWWIPAAASDKTIVFLHGYAGSCDPDLKYAPALHAAGFNLLLFDFRAHGRSGGHLTTIGALEVRDCLAAIQFAREKGSREIGLLGFSMGGRVTLLTGARHPQGINTLISDGGPARLITAFTANLSEKGLPRFLSTPLAYIIVLGMSLRAGLNLFTREPLYKAAAIAPLPVLFIHGDRDPHTSLAELEAIVKAAGSNAQVWRVPQAGHRDAEDFIGGEYLERVIAFFKSNL